MEVRLLANADGINQRRGVVNRITTVIRRKRKRHNLPPQRGDASHGTLLPSERRSSAHTDIQLNYKYIIYPLVFCVKNESENGALDGILASPTRGSSRTFPSGGEGPPRGGTVWQGLHGAKGQGGHQVCREPPWPYLRHRVAQEGGRGHGRSLRHTHPRVGLCWRRRWCRGSFTGDRWPCR